MNCIIEKLSSGKFIFTMVCAIVFAYTAIKGILPIDKVHDIILIVIYAYFTKRNEQQNGGQK